MSDVKRAVGSHELDWGAIELAYWRGRLITALERRAVVTSFIVMTEHAPPAPFEYDETTRCMRRLRRTG